MMRRSMYSKDPKNSAPLIDIQWDRGGLMIETKSGALDIAAMTRMITQAMKEIQEAILKGKQNAKTQDGNIQNADTGASTQGAENIAS
jgi:hypothetical protein